MLNKLAKNQFIRFLFIGGINTLFGYGVFSLLLFLGLHYSLAALLSTILGILFNFKTTGVIVFNSRNNSLIFKFFGVYGVVYVLNVLGLYLFSLAGVNAYISGAILILPMACVSFVLNKKFVFKSVLID
ncbi:MAG: GtrA family protein [Patescibacteria group bacterium]